jgi:hypothetical protein
VGGPLGSSIERGRKNCNGLFGRMVGRSWTARFMAMVGSLDMAVCQMWICTQLEIFCAVSDSSAYFKLALKELRGEFTLLLRNKGGCLRFEVLFVGKL